MSEEQKVVEAEAPIEETAVSEPVETRIDKLLHAVNQIDTISVSKGSPLLKDLWGIERRGMWSKGQAVLRFFPELEEATAKPNRGGRPKAGEARPVSFRMIAEKIGRPEPTVIRWVKFHLSVGKSESDLDLFIANAAQAAVEAWQRKLVKTDDSRKDPEPDVRKAIDNQTFLNVKERIDSGEETEEDVKWLVNRVRTLTDAMKKAMQFALDEKPERVVKVCEAALGDEA